MEGKKIIFKVIPICLVLVFLSCFAFETYVLPYRKAVKAIAYSWGASGDTVTVIQTKLKNWGYYTGNVDGIYGYLTFKAIQRFQANNGLTPDGIAGDRTLSALGINTASSSASAVNVANDKDLNLLASLINGEARGEPYEGQVAVGAIVLNRTRDARFPATIAGVIYQPGAFTAVVDGQIYADLEPSSLRAARDALNGWDPSGGALYYFNPNTATSAWIWSRPLIKIIGNHRFCK